MSELTMVRRRKSYARFRSLYELLLSQPSAEEVLYRVHALIDSYSGFHSRSESERAMESIEVVIRDQMKKC